MRNRITTAISIVLLIVVISYPPQYGNGQSELKTDSLSIAEAKEIIKANIDTIKALNTEIVEKAKQVDVVSPVVSPEQFKTALDKLISKKQKVVNNPVTVKVKQQPVTKTGYIIEPQYIDRPIIQTTACRTYGGDGLKYLNLSEWMKENPGKKEKDYKQYLKELNIRYND